MSFDSLLNQCPLMKNLHHFHLIVIGNWLCFNFKEKDFCWSLNHLVENEFILLQSAAIFNFCQFIAYHIYLYLLSYLRSSQDLNYNFLFLFVLILDSFYYTFYFVFSQNLASFKKKSGDWWQSIAFLLFLFFYFILLLINY